MQFQKLCVCVCIKRLILPSSLFEAGPPGGMFPEVLWIFFFFSHPSDGAMTKCLESGGKTLKVTGQTVCHVEGDQSDLRLQV